MNIVFIGGGRAGTSLAKVLQESDKFVVKAITCLTEQEAEDSANFIGNIEYVGTDNNKAIEYGNIIFITTPDDIIKKIADKISEESNLENKYIFHISGSRASDILKSCKIKGASIGSIHPLQSLPSFKKGAENIKKAYFCIEGDENAVKMGQEIVGSINNRFFTIDSDMKGLYHAAAVFASNYINTTCYEAFSIFRQLGIGEDTVLEIIKPLITGTVNNIQELGIINALTGPISRGDINTIKNHLNSFFKYRKDDLLLYKELGKKTIELAILKEQTNKEKFLEIKEILDKY